MSFFALCDGIIAMPFESAQDYKRAGEGDRGPNAAEWSPIPPDHHDAGIKPSDHARNRADTARNKERGCPFRGVLFVGLMINESGPQVIEFNVRFGDPEAEVVLARLEGDLLPLLIACATGTLGGDLPQFCSDVALVVVMAARGYPNEPIRGSKIIGIEDAEGARGTVVLHGGTREVDGAIFADGGRVLTITALGSDVADARERAYAAIDRIEWPAGFFRRDIGWRAIAIDDKRQALRTDIAPQQQNITKRTRRP